MEKSLFYNAIKNDSFETGYDRNYNADDISDFFKFSFSTGVVKSNSVNNEPTGLKVVASSGRTINVNAGFACINGKPYINDALKSFTITANGTSANRYDYIVLRFNNTLNVRNTSLELVTGTAAIPTASSLTRTNTIYEIMLAYIKVAPSVSTISQTEIIDTRNNADVCGWFTAVKGSADYYDAIVQNHESNMTLSTATTTVITTLPTNLYNNKYSLIEVYTNGIKEPKTAYTVSLSGGYIVITFKAQKSAGSKITVNLDNFLDGEGMSTALNQYTQLVQDVADLKTVYTYNYICNGSNDNILISQIAQNFANDSTTSDNARLTINVYGNFGATAAQGGDGTSASNYRWLSIGTATTSNKRIIVDFTNCTEVNIPVAANTYNVIVFGSNTHVKGLNLKANCTGLECHVRVFFNANGGEVTAENCNFESVTTGLAYISKGGTFINCKANISSANNHAYCFLMENSNQPIVVLGGRYRAYTASQDTSIISAVVYAPASTTDAVCVLNGVNCPTVAKTSFYQKNAIRINGGYLTSSGLITALNSASSSNATVEMNGTIPLSK